MGVKLAEKAEIGIGAYAGDICLECGKVHVPNAETIAAFGEGEAILGGGESPAPYS
jgi:hypothetical protein